jgi:hypothetical protein
MRRGKSPQRRFVSCAVSLLAGMLVSLTVFADVIEIEPGESIQSALRRASADTTIRLLPGTHRENLQITRGVHLIGDLESPESVILEARMAGPVITISGDDASQAVSIEGLTIRGATGYLPDGILHLSAASLHGSTLIIEQCERNGITVSGAGAVSAIDCTFRENGQFGMDVSSDLPETVGEKNVFLGNGAPLGGYANPGLRTPLAPQTASLTLRVPEQYATLQEALDAAPPGATVELGPGTIPTGTTVWKDVTLVGRGVSETTLVPGDRKTVLLSLLSSARSVALRSVTVLVAERYPITTFGSLALHGVAVVGERGIHGDPTFAIRGQGTLDVRNSSFEDIGGVALQATMGSDVHIESSRFTSNHRDLLFDAARSVLVQDSQFTGAREESVTLTETEFVLQDCRVEDCPSGIVATGARGKIDRCTILDAHRLGLSLYGSSEVDMEGTVLSRSGLYNVFVTDDASISAASCQMTDAEGAGFVAMGISAFDVRDCDLLGNGGGGLIASGNAHGSLVSSVVEGNGQIPLTSLFGEELYAGGILVSMNAHIAIRQTSIVENGGSGLQLDQLDPAIDESLDVDAYKAPRFLPIADVSECEIARNDQAGISVLGYGELTVTDCLIAGNVEGSGIMLDGTDWVLTSPVEFRLRKEVTDGIDAMIMGCEIRDHAVAGLTTLGGASARVERCTLSTNTMGIMMDVLSWVDLRDNLIVNNDGYGIWFTSEDCDSPLGICPPEAGHLTGARNKISGPTEEKGNRVGAFSGGSFPCLTQSEDCSENHEPGS